MWRSWTVMVAGLVWVHQARADCVDDTVETDPCRALGELWIHEPRLHQPMDQQEGVARTADVLVAVPEDWADAHHPDDLVLFDAESAESFPATTSLDEATGLVLLHPDAPLPADTWLTVQGSVGTFRTSDELDVTEPELVWGPLVEVGDRRRGWTWGEKRNCLGTGSVRLDISCVDPPDEPILEYQTRITRGPEEVVLSTALRCAFVVSPDWGACDDVAHPELFGRGPVDVQLRLTDLSGNVGPWSDVTTVTTPNGCGCSTSGAPVAWLALTGILAIGLTRRNR